MSNIIKGLAVIALIVFGVSLSTSAVTSFILWDWQWFWESNTGWRVFLVITLLGGGKASHR